MSNVQRWRDCNYPPDPISTTHHDDYYDDDYYDDDDDGGGGDYLLLIDFSVVQQVETLPR